MNGTPLGKVSDWVRSGAYYFDGPTGPSSATFILQMGESLTGVFAAEFSRFASAAIETSAGVNRVRLPKSIAWLIIQSYYAAYYAAHALLRCHGISATNFRHDDCIAADTIAQALGFHAENLEATQFRCVFNEEQTLLHCSRAHGKGVHEQFWRVFDRHLKLLISTIASDRELPKQESKENLAKLLQLQEVLRRAGSTGGNWLSTVRNEVTYTHSHKAWFPYGRDEAACDKLFLIQKQWLKRADQITLQSSTKDDMQAFLTACAFLVALSVDVVRDMTARGPSAGSFLTAGPMRLLNQLGSGRTN